MHIYCIFTSIVTYLSIPAEKIINLFLAAEGIGKIFSRKSAVPKRVLLENGRFVDKYGKSNLIFEISNINERYYELKTKTDSMILRVFPDTGLVSSQFELDHIDDFENRRARGDALAGCHFTGNIVSQEDSVVVLDVCHGFGEFFYNHRYVLRSP